MRLLTPRWVSFAFMWLLAVLVGGCTFTPNAPNDAFAPTALADSSRTSLDWPGVYYGVWPDEQGRWSSWRIALDATLTYRLQRQVLNPEEPVLLKEARFEWDALGRAIRLNGLAQQGDFLVGENRLFLLDEHGRRLLNDEGEVFVLDKLPDSMASFGLFEQTWRLVEVIGATQPLLAMADTAPNFTLSAQTLAVSGFAGCNRFFAQATLATKNGLQFHHIGSTKMACLHQTVEPSFLEALQHTRSWHIQDDGLVFKGADDAPLLRFVPLS